MKKRLLEGVDRVIERSVNRLLVMHRDESLYNIKNELQRRALSSTANFIETNLVGKQAFDDRMELLRYALSKAGSEGLFCEFGVATGTSINFIAQLVQETVYGFDTFDGLPEDWGSYMGKGHFKQQCLPETKNNVVLVRGLFSDTFPLFLSQHDAPCAFMHIDSDLYSSAKTIFSCFTDRIVSGTVLVFDEYFNYPGWQNGEHRAFAEFVADTGKEFEYLAYAQPQQLAMVMK